MDEMAIMAQEQMQKCLDSLKANLNTLRTGRANAALLDRIDVDYYGEKMPLNQLASITIPEPRQLLIKPYDRNDIKAIVAALSISNLGINPINDGNTIRLILPPLTEERRRDLVRQAKKYGDACKVAIRNVRHDYMDLVTVDEYSEDLMKRVHADIQKVTDEATEEVNNIFKEKEVEIMTV